MPQPRRKETVELKGNTFKARPRTCSLTALFHELFPFLLKPGALVTLRAGAGPISWHERLKIQHLMGANHWCMSSKWYLGF